MSRPSGGFPWRLYVSVPTFSRPWSLVISFKSIVNKLRQYGQVLERRLEPIVTDKAKFRSFTILFPLSVPAIGVVSIKIYGSGPFALARDLDPFSERMP
jgi:hypothetical protein